MVDRLSQRSTLELSLTGGQALWLVDATFNTIERTAEFRFTAQPEHGGYDRILKFVEVADYRDSLLGSTAEDELASQNLLGIDLDRRAGGTRYFITTETMEVFLFTSQLPMVTLLGSVTV